MVHSIDGMIVREMQRRCHHDPARFAKLSRLFDIGVRGRSSHRPQDKLVKILWDHYWGSGFLSARIFDYLDADNLGLVGAKEIKKLIRSLPHKPFEVISVHDCFRCLPNYGNDLRRQYNNLLAEIAEIESAQQCRVADLQASNPGRQARSIDASGHPCHQLRAVLRLQRPCYQWQGLPGMSAESLRGMDKLAAIMDQRNARLGSPLRNRPRVLAICAAAPK